MNCFNQCVGFLLYLTLFTVQTYGKTKLISIIMDDSEETDNMFSNKIINDELLSSDIPQPPPPSETAKMARYIVHYSLWGSLSHISLQPDILGSPLARVYSISDGPMNASSGVPYFIMTPNDDELKDMFIDPRVSLTLTLAQTPYCKVKVLDPEDPRCAQVILTGKILPIKNTSDEWYKARNALFTRHPVMKTWPASHHWMFCKLDITRILLVDDFGGNVFPSIDDYFKVHLNIYSHDNPMLDMPFY